MPQVERGTDLKLLRRILTPNLLHAGVLPRRVARYSHVKPRIPGADLPTIRHAPIQEKLGAEVMSVGPVLEYERHHQMRRAGCRREVWYGRFRRVQVVIVAEKPRGVEGQAVIQPGPVS